MTDENNSNRAPVTSRDGARTAPAAAVPFTEKGPLQPKKESVRRRAKQAEHKALAVIQSQAPTPTKEQKAEHQAKAAAKVAAAPAGSVRKAAQQANKVAADKEAVALAGSPEDPYIATLKPGEQPTLQQLRRLSKATARAVRDEATEAGKAAGKAVRDVLIGRKLRTTPHSRMARVATQQTALKKAQANAAQ